MAKNSQVLRDKKRDKLIAKYADRREALLAFNEKRKPVFKGK